MAVVRAAMPPVGRLAESEGPLTAAGLSDVGRRRDVNEDRLHVDAARGVFIVVDGVGGQAAGGRAADIAIRLLRERLERQTGAVADRVREAITIANNEIFHAALQRPEWHGMACVLTVAVVARGRLVVGHVGDTRLYLFHGGQARKLTPDHSPVGEREDARELSELEAMRHPRRNEVFRDVGSTVHHLADRDFIHVSEAVFPADAALLLCSDGLTDLVPLDVIRQTVDRHRGAPGRVVAALVDAANEAGGKDNVTAVYVEGDRFAEAAVVSPAPAATHAPARRSLAAWGWVAATLALLAGLGGWWAWREGWRVTPPLSITMAAPVAGAIVVRSGESIMAAMDQAQPGFTVVVEPGEYRERLTLRDHVRLISRVPGGATLRLPGDATAQDAAVVAAGIVGAELSGFRIVGDEASPLGVGVITRDARVRLVELEIAGARVAALDLGAGEDVVLLGSDIHDNPGAALLLGAGAAPRIAHNSFARNATSPAAPLAFVFDAAARPALTGNVLRGLDPQGVPGLDAEARQALSRNNWFMDLRPQRSGADGAAPAPRSR